MRLRTWLVPAVVAASVVTLCVAPSAQATSIGFTTLLRVDPGKDGFAQFNDITARSASDVWAVGSTSTATTQGTPAIVHGDGVGWTNLAPPAAPAGGTNLGLNQVVPQTSGAAWVLGIATFGPDLDAANYVAHQTSAGWITQGFPVGWIMRHLSVLSPTNVWVLGSRFVSGKQVGVYEHWNGTSWSSGSLPAVPEQEFGGRSEASTWAPAYNPTTFAPALLRLRGSSWVVWPLQAITKPSGDTGVLITNFVQYSLTDAYMSVGFSQSEGLGRGLQIFHWDGVNWTLIVNRLNDSPFGMTSDGGDGVWVVSSGLTTLTYLLHVTRAGMQERVQIPATQPGGHFQLNALSNVPGTSTVMFTGQLISSTGSRSIAVIEEYGPLTA